MTKHILISYPEENLSAEAELLENQAPETCRFIWEHLPIEGRTIHGKFSGNEVFVKVEPPTAIKWENLVTLPLPGEILYYYQAGGVYVDTPNAYAEVCIIYGRNVVLRGEGGVQVFASLFARLTGDCTQLAEVCRQVRFEGPKHLRVTRLRDD